MIATGAVFAPQALGCGPVLMAWVAREAARPITPTAGWDAAAGDADPDGVRAGVSPYRNVISRFTSAMR